MPSESAILLVAHGTVEDLDDLEPFVTNIRRGRPPPPELLVELRRRYEAIGGRSPLLDHTRSLARKLEAKLGLPVRVGMRLWKPFAKDVMRTLRDEGVRRVAVVPLAQFSSAVYGDAVKEDAKALEAAGPALWIAVAPNWGSHPALVALMAASVKDALARLPVEAAQTTRVVFSAHSLPMAAIRGGDPYEQEFRASVENVVKALGAGAPDHAVAFQSQGATSGPWLGPDLKRALEEAARAGVKHVVFAPVGFLADHVEILYDLDIEAAGWARALGLTTSRIASPNDGDPFVDVVAGVATPVLRELG